MSVRRRSARRSLPLPLKFMPKTPRLTAAEAEAMLLKSGFIWMRSKGSHRIYAKGGRRGRGSIPWQRGAAPENRQASPPSHRGSLRRADSSRLTQRSLSILEVEICLQDGITHRETLGDTTKRYLLHWHGLRTCIMSKPSAGLRKRAWPDFEPAPSPSWGSSVFPLTPA